MEFFYSKSYVKNFNGINVILVISIKVRFFENIKMQNDKIFI